MEYPANRAPSDELVSVCATEAKPIVEQVRDRAMAMRFVTKRMASDFCARCALRSDPPFKPDTSLYSKREGERADTLWFMPAVLLLDLYRFEITV